MAYDGLVVAASVHEIGQAITGASVTKISQPDRNEILLTLKINRSLLRLLLNVDPSAPSVYFTGDTILSPVNAPAFCMSLRKQIGGGRVVRVYQPSSDLSGRGLERVMVFEIEHLDEMGDRTIRCLIVELMGKYSNIILVNDRRIVIDSLRHISSLQSSVREVYPGRSYFIPETVEKLDLIKEEIFDYPLFDGRMRSLALPLKKALYQGLTGISPQMGFEMCFRAGIEPDRSFSELSNEEQLRLFDVTAELRGTLLREEFSPCMIVSDRKIEEYSAVRMRSLEGGTFRSVPYEKMTELVRDYYAGKNTDQRIRSKSEDLRHLLKTLTERTARKLELQEKQLLDTDRMDELRVWGELINTYGYGLPEGAEELVCENYYDENREIRIPLDPKLSSRENSARYFERYTRLKRTKEALIPLIRDTNDQLYHLESIRASLELCENESDLNELRKEMSEFGFMRKNAAGKNRKEEPKSAPLHFVSSDGIDLYVGRNNYQNEELSFRIASPNDWWFHAKKIPGSHVIAKTGDAALPDRTCLEAAALAAGYSRAGMNKNGGEGDKIEVDYVQKRFLKRVPGAQPGFVIYHTNYSILVEPKQSI